MTDKRVWTVVALGLLGGAVVACSSTAGKNGPTMTEGGGGAMSEEGEAPSVPPGGAEAEAGETYGGAGGMPPDELAECGPGMEHSAVDPSTCVFTDTSPWVVYQADDDTPAVAEMYAVKRDLIGQMAPIKLNATLEEGWQAHWSHTWSPDGQTLTFAVQMDAAPFTSSIEVVSFDESGPHWRQRLDGENCRWSPSGKTLTITGPRGASLYERERDGSLAKVADAPAMASSIHGYWSARDEFVFAWISGSTKQAAIQRFKRQEGAWILEPLISNLALAHFAVSPKGTELVFEEPGKGGSASGALYVYDLVAGGQPRLVTGPGDYSFEWSSDGNRFLLVTNDTLAADRHFGRLAPPTA
jgi:hypothetical protein